MLFITLAPLFMIFSYFHPESLFLSNDEKEQNWCLCRQWFAFAVISFSTGLFLLKINYLARLNMVLNPGTSKACTNMLAIYLVILIIEMIVINTIQYIVIDAKCTNINGNWMDYGCTASFQEWSYVQFCLYSIYMYCQF